VSFLDFSLKFSTKVNIFFIYYIQEKNNHFEFTVDPEGNVL
jgi:hypothetical protein